MSHFHLHTPLWETHKATVTQSAVKEVCCTRCGRRFQYQVVRKAKGYADGFILFTSRRTKERALQRARRSCERQLARAIHLVPCPQCGWFQPNMVASGKRKRLIYTALAGFPAAWLVLFWQFFIAQTPPTQIDGSLPTIVGLAFCLLGIAWSLYYDPNRRKSGVPPTR